MSAKGLKIRGFVVSEKTGEPLQGVAVSLVITMKAGGSGGETTNDETPIKNFDQKQPVKDIRDDIFSGHFAEEKPGEKIKKQIIGTVYSDRVGYFSFQLPISMTGLNETQIFKSFGVFCPFDPKNEIIQLAQSIRSLEPLCFEIRVDHDVPRTCYKKTSSIQNPDVLDWELSPKSFVDNPWPVIGEEGCEKLLPSTHAVQEYFFHEILNVETATAASGKKGGYLGVLLTGEVKEYRQTWSPIGHALGEIVYSLALAPCESVNLAVIDWSREDTASRTEGIEYDESLYHIQQHDRTIDEIVNATLNEMQSGESSAWGIGAALGAQAVVPISSVPVNIGLGLTGGYSNSSASSKGQRTLSGNTVQNIADTVSQISNVKRRLRSTVIVQATQKEKDIVQTRTVFNHNHGHALTVQYYEVLRHMKVVTEYAGNRKVVLVPFAIADFDETRILKYRVILQKALLDLALSKCFDSLIEMKYNAPPPIVAPPTPTPEIPWEGDEVVRRITVTITVNNTHVSLNQQDIWFYIGADSAWTQVPFGGANSIGVGEGRKLDLVITNFNPLRKEIVLLGIWNQTNLDWTLTSFKVEWTGTNSSGVLYDSGLIEYLFPEKTFGAKYPGSIATIPPNPPNPLANPEDERQKVEAAKQQAEYVNKQVQLNGEKKMLIDHINSNKMYYNKVIWFFQDPDERAIEFMSREIMYNGKPLITQIENAPLAVKGNYVAFPLIGQSTRGKQPGDSEPDVKIIGIPTRGVFAEAMLSNCNAIEKRDITRYWDWMEERCQGAPEIQNIQPGSRNVTPDLQPSSMPSPVVQIMNTPSVPDPTGLSAAFNLLGKSDIFRDMSGQKETAKLLDDLVSGAVTLAQAKAKAQEIKDTQSKTGTSGSSNGNSFSIPKQTPQEKYDNLLVAKETAKAADELGWDAQTKSDHTSAAATGGSLPLNMLEEMMTGAAPTAGAASVIGLNAADKALETIGEQAKKFLDTPELKVEGPEDVTEVLKKLNDPARYQPPGGEKLNEFFFVFVVKNLGGGTLLDGVNGTIGISWIGNCLIDSEVLRQVPLRTAKVWGRTVFRKNIAMNNYQLNAGLALDSAQFKISVQSSYDTNATPPQIRHMLVINIELKQRLGKIIKFAHAVELDENATGYFTLKMDQSGEKILIFGE